jgi:hypothetical protein
LKEAAAAYLATKIIPEMTPSPAPICPTGSTFNGANCLSASNRVSTPTCPSGYNFDNNKCTAIGSATSRSYDYLRLVNGDPLSQDGDNGAPPDSIDADAPPLDTGATRPTTGPVFEEGGVFSGNAGTGQNTASGLVDFTGNITGGGAYGMWPSTRGSSSAVSGNNLPVKGPSWGGKEARASARSSTSSQPAPTLYGPQAGSDGIGSGYPQLNSRSANVGNMCTTGSDPNNIFAVTSRCPGDQDIIPNPYLQSTTYSLANGSAKTNPVPFLSDFSVFQR